MGEIIWQGRPPWRSFIALIALAAFVPAVIFYFVLALPDTAARMQPLIPVPIYLIPFIVLFLLLLTVIIARYSKLYLITERRIAAGIGLIRRDEKSASFDKITDMRVKQGIAGRILDYGDLQISTAGSSGYEINFINVESPYYVKKLVDEQIEKKEAVKMAEEKEK